MHEKDVADGLISLLHATRRFADSFPAKLEAMQDFYLRASVSDYDETDREMLRYYLRAFSFKFYLATLHLEQLWSLAHGAGINPPVRVILENSFDRHDLNNDSLLLTGFVFETLAVQAIAAFDFIAQYFSCYFHIGPIQNLSEHKLKEELDKISDPDMHEKALATSGYYSKPRERDRRDLLRRVRHSLVHRDKIYPSFTEKLSLLEQVVAPSPEWVVEEQISEFSQEVQNDLFFLATNLLPNLYDLDWIPGPYRLGLWD